LPRVRVVLVRAENSANVGACARVVRNAGLEGLDLVAPGDWRTVDCWRSAWGAQDVLEEARVFPDLLSALATAVLTIALSGRRPASGPTVDVREAVSRIGGLAREDRAALVFGPETSGLTNDEVALCGLCARIPSHPAQPSYNLSHAVAIAAYETLRVSPRGEGPSPARATHDDKERALDLLRQGLLAVRALPAVRTESRFREWRALVQRADLTPKEVRLLQHLARKMARARA
jgi:tRNA/rRNA methyltransferase